LLKETTEPKVKATSLLSDQRDASVSSEVVVVLNVELDFISLDLLLKALEKPPQMR